MKIICVSLRRYLINLGKGAEQCVSDNIYVHAEEAYGQITCVPSKEIQGTSIQLAPKWDLEYQTRSAKLKLISASSYEFSTMRSVPQTRIIEGVNHSMLIHSGTDLDVEKMWQAPELALVFSDLLPTALWRNDVRRASPLFLYLVVWSPKDYIPSIIQWVWRDEEHMKDVPIKLSLNHLPYMI